MSKPTTRVLALLELLQTHGLISGVELARRLEVDPRTLRRYIQALSELGIPVMAERGCDGGYRLMHGFKLPPMMFTNDEALALALGLQAARDLGLSALVPAGAGALAKLLRVMPENLRQRIGALQETVALDILRAESASAGVDTGGGGSAGRVEGDPAVLASLGLAARGGQSVRLEYQARQQTITRREIDPYALVLHDRRWYVVAYCHLRRALRSFRLDRIQSLQLLPASFARPAQFDAAHYLRTAIASLPRAHSVSVLLHTDLASAQAAVFTGLGLLQPLAGGVMLHSQVDDLAWMARELARLPFGFEIEQPPALRSALAQHAQALLQALA